MTRLKIDKKYFIFLWILILSLFLGCSLSKTDNQSNVNDVLGDEHHLEETPKLQSVEVLETDDSLTLNITGYNKQINEFMKGFSIDYERDYHVLTFSNPNVHLASIELLVNKQHVTDISRSQFIRKWFRSPEYPEHYNILFNFPITYTTYVNEARGVVTIVVKKDIFAEESSYFIRSPSMSHDELEVHLGSIVHTFVALDIDLKFRILKDRLGFFYIVESYPSVLEARDRLEEILSQYESTKHIYFQYEKKYQKKFNLLIENPLYPLN